MSNIAQHAANNYNAAFPDRVPLSSHKGMLGGCWLTGACYKNPNPLYGAYPHGYLERVHAMFPDAKNVLHAYSGGLTEDAAIEAWRKGSGETKLGGPSPVTLVDMHGPEQGRYPTHQMSIEEFCEQSTKRFDLVLADPPYSDEDAKKYDCPAPNRRKVIAALRRVAAPGAVLVWLDVMWPQHRKAEWRTFGTIGFIRSTNHRARVVSLFEAV